MIYISINGDGIYMYIYIPRCIYVPLYNLKYILVPLAQIPRPLYGQLGIRTLNWIRAGLLILLDRLNPQLLNSDWVHSGRTWVHWRHCKVWERVQFRHALPEFRLGSDWPKTWPNQSKLYSCCIVSFSLDNYIIGAQFVVHHRLTKRLMEPG